MYVITSINSEVTIYTPIINNMDLRLINGAVFQIVGPSGSGKTHFVTQLLKKAREIFQKPIRKIYWLMGTGDDGEVGDTEKHLKCIKNITFLKGFEKGWQSKPQQDDVIVIDDLFTESTKEHDFNNLFTKIARHRQVTVIFITQNLFHQGGQHRTRNLNVHYLVIFKNPRDGTVVDYLARQAYPTNRNFLIDAFRDATDDVAHGYLFLDFTQACPETLRVRTDIFNPQGIFVYKQNESST